jgi:RNA polymerase sigma-70 factor (ECF subfamily)
MKRRPDEALPVDDRIRGVLEAGDVRRAATAVVRELGPEVLGFLRASLGSDDDADDVFALVSERIWKAIGAFRWECSLRTWVYVIARHEAAHFLRGARRHNARNAGASELDRVVAAVRTETRSALRSGKADKLKALRDELSMEDRTILILRVDRDMPWEDIARVFLNEAEAMQTDLVKREAARLRKRFQLVRRVLAERARAHGILT